MCIKTINEMKKGKKITIKPFLNKNYPWKTIKELSDGNSEEINLYPVYVQITFNRRNTQVKSLIDEYFSDLDEITGNSKTILEAELKTYQKIVELESEKMKDKFTLKGINNRLTEYIKPVYKPLGENVKADYYRIILKARSEFSIVLANVYDFKIPFKRLLKATRILIPNFDTLCDDLLLQKFNSFCVFDELFPERQIEAKIAYYPTVIDFLDGSFLNLFKQKLIAKNIYTENEISTIVSTINLILKATIKV